MTTITVFTRFPDTADVRRVEDIAKLGYIELVCHGVSYKPAEVVRANNLYKCIFEVMTEPDNTPALGVQASDGIYTGEKLG